MASMNYVALAGNLTQDVELKNLPSGTAVTDLRLAIDDSYTKPTGEKIERAVFVDVSVWGRQAETCAQYLSKGSPVLVEGRLQFDQWETPQGEKRSKIQVRAQRVQFLGRPRDQRDNEPAPPREAGRAQAPAAPAAPAPTRPPEDVFQDTEEDAPF